MDREFLVDYEAKENEKFNKIFKEFKLGEISAFERYPTKKQFEVHKPYSYQIPGEKIYYQIPYYNTLIIPLVAASKKYFESANNIKIDEIDSLINLYKKNKSIQFILYDSPTKFENFDHFDNIFKECNPPLQFHYFPDISTEDILEFFDYVQYGFMDIFNYNYPLGNRTYKLMDDAIEINSQIYSFLKAYGYTDICELFQDYAIGREFEKAFSLICLSSEFLVLPYLSPFQDIVYSYPENLTLSLMKKSGIPEYSNIDHQIEPCSFPYEIGKFLVKNLTVILPDIVLIP